MVKLNHWLAECPTFPIGQNYLALTSFDCHHGVFTAKQQEFSTSTIIPHIVTGVIIQLNSSLFNKSFFLRQLVLEAGIYF